MEIRCRKANCAHNTGSSCRARAVRIDKKTAACETYAPQDGKDSLAIEKGKIFRVAERMPGKNTNDIPLRCCARNCLFNRQERCIANGITVLDDIAPGKTPSIHADKATCATFVEE